MSEQEGRYKLPSTPTVSRIPPWYRSACRTFPICGPGRWIGRGVAEPALREQTTREFEEFIVGAEPRLRVALIAAYGPDRGREAAAEALAYAWEHWPKLRSMSNIAGYLYRVGRSAARPRRDHETAPLFSPAEQSEPWFEPGLAGALAALTDRQRMAVVLVHGFSWTLREVADIAGLRVTSVQNHLERGMSKLRAALEVSNARPG
jgi:DNA-directed RNA polymerase specialized sigma24 family protein